MTEIRYADMRDKELLRKNDTHIKENACEDAIRSKRYLVMFVDGRFAGWLRYGLFWDEIPFMNMLYFFEDCRGKGYGAQIVSFWEAEMKKLGHHQIMTSSQANEKAQHFYRKLGYRDAGGFFPFCDDFELFFTKEL